MCLVCVSDKQTILIRFFQFDWSTPSANTFGRWPVLEFGFSTNMSGVYSHGGSWKRVIMSSVSVEYHHSSHTALSPCSSSHGKRHHHDGHRNTIAISITVLQRTSSLGNFSGGDLNNCNTAWCPFALASFSATSP